VSDSIIELLKHTDLFSRVSDRELRALAKLLKERHLKRNQILFRQGDTPDSLYVVTSGRLKISAPDKSGQEKVLAFLGAGEIVGEMGLLGGTPRSATAAGSTDVDLLQLRKADFDALVATNLDAMRDLARAVARRKEATQQRMTEEGYHDGLITTVFSPRGGAGTTTLATNLAVALAQRAPDRVVLLDLNLSFGHAPVLLNLVPRTSLSAISAVSLRQMDRENVDFYLTRHSDSSLRVLSGALRPEQGELVTGEHVKAVTEVMRKHFVHVIIDIGRSFSEVNLSAIESTHSLLIVCTPERIALRNVSETQRIVRELLHLPGDPMHYVVNHPSPYESLKEHEIERELGAQLLESIPFGGDAPARAALEGQPLVMRWPNSPTTKAINRIADRLEQQLAEVRALAPFAYLTVS